MSKTNGTEQRKLLEEPFPPELICSRPGHFGQELSYVEAVHYIRRLNQAYDGEWSFEIVSHRIEENEVIVIGKLIAGGVIKMAFGSSDITRRKDTGEIVCIGDDLKAASTDALKKAASLLGLGLDLYQNGRPEKSNPKKLEPENSPAKKNGRLTSRQLSAILAIGKDQELNREALSEMSRERFGKNLEFIDKTEASDLIQELKN